jgi:nicotinate-nucleotide pyrophosphorylase
MIMLKDNHIDFAGGIALAVAKLKITSRKRTRFKNYRGSQRLKRS